MPSPFSRKKEALAAQLRAGAGPVGLAKETSNLFRDRAPAGRRRLDVRGFNERFRRIWRVYLYGCAEMFRSPVSQTHLFQVVCSKGNVSRTSYPMTREFLYRPPA